jgi:hypothetical protein
MTPLRAAVLVFLFGASFANAIALKGRMDLMNPGWLHAPWVHPTATPDSKNQFFDMGPDSRDAGKLAFDTAWFREAIIVTIAGIAWFVLRAREVET